MIMRAACWGSVAILLVLPGCLGGVFVVNASSPLVLSSFAYDGRQGREAEGSLKATLYEGRNDGRIEATYQDELDEFRIKWVNFTGGFPYQSDGVARDVDLFGDSGNGTTAWPRLRVHAAAWGTVEFYVDGERKPDPHSLFQTLDAVFFVSQGTYRDNESRTIKAASGTGTYDPSRPADSSVNRIGAMAVIGIFTKRGDLFRLVEFSDVEIVAS